MKLIESLKSLLLLSGLRERVRAWHRQHVFNRAIKQFARNPAAVFDSGNDLLNRLIYGWGNPAYGSEHEYLVASLRSTQAAEGPVLECGSGLSTLLTGIVAAQSGNIIWSLEHHPFWAKRVRKALDDHGIASVRLDVNPLKSYGEFDWYDPAIDEMPSNFAVLLCDGPPGNTHGGRYGCLPVMRSRLAAGCTIIIDDAERDAEREMASRWAEELGTDFQQCGSVKPYFELRAPGITVARSNRHS
jgi:hypothetical protein